MANQNRCRLSGLLMVVGGLLGAPGAVGDAIRMLAGAQSRRDVAWPAFVRGFATAMLLTCLGRGLIQIGLRPRLATTVLAAMVPLTGWAACPLASYSLPYAVAAPLPVFRTAVVCFAVGAAAVAVAFWLVQPRRPAEAEGSTVAPF